MIAFVLGYGAMCVCLATLPALAKVWLGDEPAWYAARMSGSLALLCAVQALASALGTSAVQRVTPRTLLMRSRWSAGSVALGLFAALLGNGLALVAAAAMLRRYGDARDTEGGVIGACAFAASVGVLLCTRRHRARACPGCGYDMRALTTASHGRCPECGRDHFAMKPA